MEILLSEEGGYVGQAKIMDVFYPVIHFLQVAKYIKKKKSILLFSWQHPMVPLLACFGFCEITLPILPFSALTHLHGSFFFPSFSSWYVVGHLDVSLYSYPYNFRKHITSGYCLYNDGSQIWTFCPDLSWKLEIYIFNFFSVSLGGSVSHRCLNDNAFKTWNLHFPPQTLSFS